MVKDVPLTILTDPGATDSFISLSTIAKCGLATRVQSNFDLVEMALSKKQAIGVLVIDCTIRTGNLCTKMKLCSTSLGSYDLIVGMDWIEYHRALVDCYEKKVFCNNDLGEPIVIQGLKQDVSL
jgi:hypothetical protein